MGIVTELYRRSSAGVFAMFAFLFCGVPAVHSEDTRFEEVEAWSGSYRASVQAENSGRIAMVDTLKEQQTVSAQVVLDRREISRRRITWEGTATCNASGSFYGKATTPGSPLFSEESGSGSSMFETEARLVVHPGRDRYTITLCRQTFTYDTVVTGTGISEQGQIVPVTEDGEHKLNPGKFLGSSLMPEGPLPREGFHLTGSFDVDGGPGGQFGKGMNFAALSGMEASGKVQWSFSPDLCSETGRTYAVRIIIPEEPIELDFSRGELDQYFYAEPMPDKEDLRARLAWQPFEIEGSKRTVDPESLDSDRLGLTFTGTPEENDAFGEKEIFATLKSLQRCTEPARKKVTVFYERDGNEGGPDNPNWMRYWLQTSAGKGFAPFVRLGKGRPCISALGYFSFSSEGGHFFICDTVLKYRPSDPFDLLVGKKLHSIDVFAITAIHENQHMIDRREWWSGIPRNQWPGRSDHERADYDQDLVPDEVEIELGYNPVDRDTLDIGYSDVEISAYRTADQWVVGSADEEDWACPGAQGEGDCREEPR